MFHSTDPQKGWDGRFEGQDCNSGAFVWWVKYKDKAGSQNVFKKGAVTLLR